VRIGHTRQLSQKLLLKGPLPYIRDKTHPTKISRI
jgi:hypothetical protein